MSSSNVLKTIKDKEIEYVDLRFTDPRGKLQHVTMDAKIVDGDMLNAKYSVIRGTDPSADEVSAWSNVKNIFDEFSIIYRMNLNIAKERKLKLIFLACKALLSELIFQHLALIFLLAFGMKHPKFGRALSNASNLLQQFSENLLVVAYD